MKLSIFRHLAGFTAPLSRIKTKWRQARPNSSGGSRAGIARCRGNAAGSREQVEVKMKSAALAAVALVTATAAASAADIPRGPAPYYTAQAPLGVYSWAGPYLGLNAGYQSGSVTNNPTEPSGIVGGVTAGYNWQSGQFVFGGETDLQISNADDTFAPWQFSNPWFGTLRGRAGYAFNNILLYATLGLAYGGLTADTAGLSESRTHVGWTGGLGMEVGLTGNWSAKAEYLYLDFADRGYTVTGVSNGFESSLLRFGVNYRF
jgi:outer membrane immunogenic protein